ncbi:MAG: low molecular weight phosphatase family protein [Candidatus Caldatribacteriota bacterium]|nr:low molecular weight phosphatase family protein [Candidatus Caldatribacteriota bacterium]
MKQNELKLLHITADKREIKYFPKFASQTSFVRDTLVAIGGLARKIFKACHFLFTIMENKIILFVCKGNSGRSQMAEAFLNRFCKTAKAISAGVKPDEKIHPWTIQVMQEVGINVSQQKPKPLTEDLMKKADKIIAMDSDLIKDIPPKYLSKTENWRVEKLLGKSIEDVKKIRDEIGRKAKELCKKF